MAANKRPSPKPPKRRAVPDQVEYAANGLAWLREQFTGPADGAEPPAATPVEVPAAPETPTPEAAPPTVPPPQITATAPVEPVDDASSSTPDPASLVLGGRPQGQEAPDIKGSTAAVTEPPAAAKPAHRRVLPPAPMPPPPTPPPPPPPPPAAGQAGRPFEPVRPPDAPPRPAAPPAPATGAAPAGRNAPAAGEAAGSRPLQQAQTAGAAVPARQRLRFRRGSERWRSRSGLPEAALRALAGRIAVPLPGCRRVAVIALKGGVGKTTTTACLGAALAEHRGDRIVAVDANPDGGTLGYRVRRDTQRTTRDLLAVAARLTEQTDLRAYASQAVQGLDVIAAEADPELSQAFGADDYRKVVAVLEKFYAIILTDCGPGLLHDAMRGILALADQLVVVSAASLDGARAASLTLDWLERHGHGELARQAVVVINATRPRGSVDVGQLEQHFTPRVRSVLRVPYDQHLEAGAEIVFAQLALATRHAYLELAATVADGLGSHPAKPPPADAGSDAEGKGKEAVAGKAEGGDVAKTEAEASPEAKAQTRPEAKAEAAVEVEAGAKQEPGEAPEPAAEAGTGPR